MAELMLVNPRRRRRRASPKRKTTRRRRRNPVGLAANPRKRVSAYRRRRNPARSRGFGDILQTAVMPAATAAGGALALDVGMGLLPLPAAMKTGPMRHLVKGAGAIGMGMLAQMFVKPETAKLFTSGALTVTMYDAGKELMGRFVPQLKLGAYMDEDLEGLAYVGQGHSSGYEEEAEDEMGAYMDMEGMGLSLTDELDL